jgi:protein involved in polysaccharide export with SLBB domain
MKNLYIFVLLTLSLISVQSFSQDFQAEDKYKAIFNMLKSQGGQGLDNFQGASQLNQSVNPDEYMVDVGDVFIIKIDVKGPATKIFTASVYPEGYLMLEEVPSVYIKKTPLKAAKRKIKREIRKKYPDALIEVFLYSVHNIEVTILGAVKEPGIYELKSSDRLYAAYQTANSENSGSLSDGKKQFPGLYDPKGLREFEAMQEELAKKKMNTPTRKDTILSIRKVIIKRDDKEKVIDLLKYVRLGDMRENPYLEDGDIIYFPYADKNKYQIQVKGAVGNELNYEYKPGENLKSAVDMAGGLLPSADSSSIKLFRFSSDSEEIRNIVLSYPRDSDFILYPDDRIFVRFKPEFHLKNSVEVMGEIKYPGVYAITDGETTLSEIIRQAGKFTKKASLKNAIIIRSKFLPEDKELKRLSKMAVKEMNSLELSYFKLRSRENLRLVSVDFEKLFKDNQVSENVILRDGDVIVIPERKNIVYVSGGVFSPGNITFHEGWNYLDYINSAGGFNLRAIEGKTQVIKNKTGVWFDADEENLVIEEGDIIFVPEEEEVDWYQVFRESLTIVFQVATIALLIANLVKN